MLLIKVRYFYCEDLFYLQFPIKMWSIYLKKNNKIFRFAETLIISKFIDSYHMSIGK